jgi:dihydrolipoamide dehydrogenase
MADRFDLVIIGGGNAGYVPAIRAAQLDMSVALVEREEHLGGTCLNLGCIPTKALLETAARLHEARTGEDFGVRARDVELDYGQAAKRRDEVVEQLRGGVKQLMGKHGVEVLRGSGSFVEPRKVRVEDGDGGTRELEARYVLIATGSAVATVPGLDLDGEQVISSDDIVTSDADPPSSVVVLGSGAVGVEFASMYADFGAEVTLVEMDERILPQEDQDVSAALQQAFEDRGIRVLVGAKLDPGSLERGDGRLTVAVEANGETERLEADALLVAVGRRTVLDDLNLEATAVQVDDDGHIRVDELCRTEEEGVYAAGDVIGGHWLAHAASHEGIVAVEHMAGEDPMPLDQDAVPRVTFSRPEVASFGLTKEQADERGHEAEVATFPFRAVGKALIEGDGEGFVKVVTDAGNGRILGMHAIGPHVTDLIAEGTLGKLVEATAKELAMNVHPHPSLAEVMGEAAMAADGRPLHA